MNQSSKIKFFNKMRDLNKQISSYDIVFIDRKVFNYYPQLSIDTNKTIKLSASEKLKDFETIIKLTKKLVKKNCRRSSKILVIGGGSIGDSIGFLCSIYMRGMTWSYTPTTLLSQIDSAHGGKTAINFENNKNLLGSFYFPKNIYIFPQFISSLPKREINSGLGEAYKYKKLGLNIKLNKITPDFIRKCIKFKYKFIHGDEYDILNKRIFLNYGHTLGHALEAAEGHSKWKHGEAVLRGVHFAEFLQGNIEDLDKKIKIPKLEYKNIDSIIKKMNNDKKNNNQKIRFILRDGTKYFTEKSIKEKLKQYVQYQ